PAHRHLSLRDALPIDPPSILERMAEILGLLRDAWSLLFSSLTGGERRRSEIVVTLLAVLELVRLGRIKTQQTEAHELEHGEERQDRKSTRLNSSHLGI